jgi:hypothetical protein
MRVIAPHDRAMKIPHFDFYAADPPMRRWLPLGEVVEVNHSKEWIDELRAGVLIAADSATAKLAQVSFKEAAVKAALTPAAKPVEEK